MYGPEPKGHWSDSKNSNLGQEHGHLRAGWQYKVIREFEDFDKDKHNIGEAWTFLGSSFAPYDDGLSLFVSLDGEHEWQIRMQWRPEEQGPIIDALKEYIKEA